MSLQRLLLPPSRRPRQERKGKSPKGSCSGHQSCRLNLLPSFWTGSWASLPSRRAEGLLAWTKISLPLKNTLLEADARVLEAAYQKRFEEAALPDTYLADQWPVSAVDHPLLKEHPLEITSDTHAPAGASPASRARLPTARRHPLIHITSSLRNHGRWDAKSATNSPSPFADPITNPCTGTATKEPGGPICKFRPCQSRSGFGMPAPSI